MWCFVGNVKPHKNSAHCSEPSRIFAIGFLSDWSLWVADLDFGLATLRCRVWRIRLGSVKFTGEVTDSQVRELSLVASALVQPSLYEGFGCLHSRQWPVAVRSWCHGVAAFPSLWGCRMVLRRE